jgi:4-hydroxybenzoate polyprenyltransferase
MSTLDVSGLVKSIPVLISNKKRYVFGWPWGLAYYLLIVGNGFPPIRPTILLILSLFFVAASVYVYNDIQDVDMDRENEIKKNRAIASGQVRIEDARILVYVFGLIGLGLAWLVNIYSFAFIFTYFALFYFYSHPQIRLKNRFLGKDFTLFVAYPILCLAANFAVTNDISLLAVQCSLLTAIYVLTQGPVANEASDIIEDKKYGVKSISTMLNWRSKVQIMILGILAQIVLLPLIQIQYGVNLILPIFSILVLILTLVSSYPLLQQYNLNDYNKAQRISTLYMMVLPITFILLSMRLPILF